MGGTPVFASNVAVESHRIAVQCLVADRTVNGFSVSLLIFFCHVHWLLVVEHRLDLALFHLQGGQKVFGCVWSAVELWWLGLPVTSDHHVAVAAGFVAGCLLRAALGGV